MNGIEQTARNASAYFRAVPGARERAQANITREAELANEDEQQSPHIPTPEEIAEHMAHFRKRYQQQGENPEKREFYGAVRTMSHDDQRRGRTGGA